MEGGQGEQQALLQARVENAQREVEKAEQQLASATDAAGRTIWENRLQQYRRDLEKAQADFGE